MIPAALFIVFSQHFATPVAEFSPGGKVSIRYVSFSSGAKQLSASTVNGELITWDVASKRVVRVVVMGREVRDYEPASSNRIYTLHADGSIGLRNMATGQLLRTADFTPDDVLKRRERGYIVTGITSIEASGDVLGVTVAGDSVAIPNRLLIVRYPERILFRLPLRTFALSNDGHFVVSSYTGDSRGGLAVYDVPSGSLRRILRTTAKGEVWALSRDGKFLAMGARWTAHPVYIVDTANGRIVTTITPPNAVDALKFSNDRRYLAIRGTWGAAWLYSTAGGKRIATYGGSRGAALMENDVLAFSDDGKLLAVAFGEGVVRVYRVP
jgi:WD40 repeat protein